MKKVFLSLLFASSLFATNVYKVGISPDYPPFDMLVDGKISGFDVELLENVAKIADVKIEFKAMSFDGLISALKAGKIDLIASAMSASEQRQKACDFSDVYYEAKTIYIKHRDFDGIDTKADLKGKKVGVQLGTVQEIAVKSLGAKVMANETPTILILALNDKKIDAIAFDALVAREFLSKNPNLEEFYSESDGTKGFSFAFSKGKNKDLQEKLNQALKEFMQTDEYKLLLNKYKII